MTQRASRERLPELMTCRMVSEETGLPRSTVTALMRRCELIRPDGVRVVFVRREQIMRLVKTVRP